MKPETLAQLAKVAYEIFSLAVDKSPYDPWEGLMPSHKTSWNNAVTSWVLDNSRTSKGHSAAYSASYAATMALYHSLQWTEMKEQQVYGLEVRLEAMETDVIQLQLKHERERQLREACQSELVAARIQLAAYIAATGVASM